MDPKIIALYDEYTHAPLPRRVFMKRLTALAGSTTAAMALLPLLENDYAQAAMVAETDERIATETISYPAHGATISGYLAKPRSAAKAPAVLVIHENRGLNPHIQDIARRLATAGFLALAPDMLSGMGGTPSDEDKAREMIAKLDRAATVDGLLAAVPYLKGRVGSTGKVGCVGFCWGGAMANAVAVGAPDLTAAVVFYGRQPSTADAARIRARLLLHYAGLDQRVNAGMADYEAALKAAGVDYRQYVYEGANHAFNNDTNAARYNAEAAKLAWERTIAFLKESLA